MLINTYVNAKIVITYDFKKGDIWCSMIKSYASIKKVCSVFELKNAFDCKHSQIVITLIINHVLMLLKKRFAIDLIWKDYSAAADGPCCKCLIWTESWKEFSPDYFIIFLLYSAYILNNKHTK